MPTKDHTTGTQGGLRVARKKVLDMLVAGRANQEVALSLGIAVRTVKACVAKLMNKTGTHNRTMRSIHVITHSLGCQLTTFHFRRVKGFQAPADVFSESSRAKRENYKINGVPCSAVRDLSVGVPL
jgi:hypothetical protein